jgi:cellulose synthase/poly-beta-1,6-N-acetylglucosamine synthase-like glycosyltransferase
MSRPRYSVVVPVYNRPQELDELLNSLVAQDYKNFEVIVVEDGSSSRSDLVTDKYRDKLHLDYFHKPNTGPGPSRNVGFGRARGDYFVVFDSDCLLPSHYFTAVNVALDEFGWDAWGGPDKAHEKFTVMQRAMGYTMSSVLTTGGIRGGKKHVGLFQPRSFNMGISRVVFEHTKGFVFDRFAEDIEFSIRMHKAGFKVGLIPDAYVFHKRRTTFTQFFNQVQNFGRGRAQVGKAHPGEVKLTHWFPSVFTIGLISLLILPFLSTHLALFATLCYILYVSLIFLHSFSQSRDIRVAALSVPSALIQLTGYGIGFLKEWFRGTRVGPGK